jgi:predicted phage-related endonuclease
MKTIHNIIQGTDEWAAFRLQHHGASEAAAMLGMSPKTARAELLRAKHTGLAREFSDWLQRNVLDKGHDVERMARPYAESFIGEDLYAVTCSEGRLSSSCDGLTIGEEIAWEHKSATDENLSTVRSGRIPDEHMPQCQQVLMVTGAEKLLFTVSDGTPERMAHAWVKPDPEWFQRLRDGWALFDRDLAAYVLPAAEVVTAAPVETLPAVAVRMDGALVVQSNLPAFGEALKAFVGRVPKRPSTDQEFADTEAACKALKRAEDALDAAEANALASLEDVNSMRRMVADFRNLARETRLASEKMVERRKAEVKEEAVVAARRALDAHIAALNAEIAPMRLPAIAADFAGAIKGKRSITSMQEALDGLLVATKIAAEAEARAIRANLAAFRELALDVDFGFLFPDLGQIVHKAAEDFALLVRSRIATHKAAEDEKERQRQAAEAQRIAQAEQRAREQEAARIAAQQVVTGTPGHMLQDCSRELSQALASKPDAMQHAREAAAAITSEPATLNLGAICGRLGFTVSAAFLAETLHIQPAKTDKASKLYSERQFRVICRQLQAHVGAMAEMYVGEAA